MLLKWPFFKITQKFFFGGAEAWETLILSCINIFGSGHFMTKKMKKHDFDRVDMTPKKLCFHRTKSLKIRFTGGQTWTYKALFSNLNGRWMFEAINLKSLTAMFWTSLRHFDSNQPLLFWCFNDSLTEVLIISDTKPFNNASQMWATQYYVFINVSTAFSNRILEEFFTKLTYFMTSRWFSTWWYNDSRNPFH